MPLASYFVLVLRGGSACATRVPFVVVRVDVVVVHPMAALTKRKLATLQALVLGRAIQLFRFAMKTPMKASVANKRCRQPPYARRWISSIRENCPPNADDALRLVFA